MDINDENKYLAHEFAAPGRERQNPKPKAEPVPQQEDIWDEKPSSINPDAISEARSERMDAVSGKVPEEAVEEEPTEEIALSVEPYALEDLIANTLESASFEASLLVSDDSEAERCFFYSETKPFFTDGGAVNVIDTVNSLKKSEDWVDLGNRFNALNGIIPSKVWYELERRFLGAVNDLIKHKLNMALDLSNFSNTIVDLDELVKEEYSSEVYLMFKDSFKLILTTCANVLSGKDLNDYLSRIEFEIKDPEDVKNIVVFAETVGVVEVSSKLQDVIPGASISDVINIQQSNNKELYDTVHEFMKTVKGNSSAVRKVYVLTKDQYSLSIVERLGAGEISVYVGKVG